LIWDCSNTAKAFSRRLIVPDAADGADGADGIFKRPPYRNNPVSCSAFTTECNLDAQDPQEGLRATQPASEGARIFGPAGTVT
jgi:hypothetical protein